MASALYHQNNPLFTQSLHQKNYNYSYFCYSTILPLKSINTNYSTRLRTTLIKSSRDKNRIVLSETSVDNTNSNSDSGESRVKSPDPDPGPDSDLPSSSSLLDSVSSLLKLDGIGWEIMSIALPAALALAADPITSLVDTAFVGHLGTFLLSLLCYGYVLQ